MPMGRMLKRGYEKAQQLKNGAVSLPQEEAQPVQRPKPMVRVEGETPRAKPTPTRAMPKPQPGGRGTQPVSPLQRISMGLKPIGSTKPTSGGGSGGLVGRLRRNMKLRNK